MIIIRTTKMHLQKKLNISEFRRRRLYSFRVCVHFPIILQYHQKNVLNAYPFCVFSASPSSSFLHEIFCITAASAASAALVLMSFFFQCTNFLHSAYIFSTVFCIVCEMDAMHGYYISYQGSISEQTANFISFRKFCDLRINPNRMHSY